MPHDATAVANRLIRLADDEGNELTALQLNKLAYFCQAWMLGLYERPLIEQPILALATGPIILDIYRSFRKHHGDPVRVKPGVRKADFDHMEEDLVQQVYSKYGHLSGIRLSELSHEEDTPWDKVWRQNGQRSIIPRNLMKDHCSRQAQEARECRAG